MTERVAVVRFADDVAEAERAELDKMLHQQEFAASRGIDLDRRGQREDAVAAVINLVDSTADVLRTTADAGRGWLQTRRRANEFLEIEDRATSIVFQITANDPDHAFAKLGDALQGMGDGPYRWQGSVWQSSDEAKSELARTVFVIHGRDKAARKAVYAFLRALDLHPIEWNEALAATKQGAPHIGDVVGHVLGMGTAVVVLQTPDDEVRLRPEHADGDDDWELAPHGQARPNVFFEAGMVFARRPDETIIVEFGKVRPFTDIGGRNVVKLDNSPKMKHRFAERLRAIGCAVNTSGDDWLSVELTPPEEPPRPTATSSPGKPSSSGRNPTLGNFSVTRDSLGMHTVHGEIKAGSIPVAWLMLKATFYAGGKITGSAMGVVRNLELGEEKSFSLTTSDDVYGYDDYKVQIESMH
ncbi:TIR domain-containing protein [Amycolatopsis sp. MJM2582]|uniref:TIR domain-containing protein n=1 Tax=Amycolatopsis sp. MJM2582 TaxID=1427749 RepID=UPI0006925A2E|nr:nucleotide-binding protein [Amycolatopsis sp. MJM2582]